MKGALLLVLLLSIPCLTAQPRVRAVATIQPLAWVLRAVGGERVEVTYLVPVGSDPHQYAPSPGEAMGVAGADLFVCVGREPFLGMLPPCRGLVLGWENWTEVGVVVEDDDPHYIWLYPPNMRRVATKVFEALVAVDPEGEGYYRARLGALLRELEELEEWVGELVDEYGVRGAPVAMAGSHLVPLVKFMGLRVTAVLVKSEGAVPGPSELREFVEAARRSAAIVVLATQRLGDEGRLAAAASRDSGRPLIFAYGIPLRDEPYTEFVKYTVATIVGGVSVALQGWSGS